MPCYATGLRFSKSSPFRTYRPVWRPLCLSRHTRKALNESGHRRSTRNTDSRYQRRVSRPLPNDDVAPLSRKLTVDLTVLVGENPEPRVEDVVETRCRWRLTSAPRTTGSACPRAASRDNVSCHHPRWESQSRERLRAGALCRPT